MVLVLVLKSGGNDHGGDGSGGHDVVSMVELVLRLKE